MIDSTKAAIGTFLVGTVGVVEVTTPVMDWLTKINAVVDLISSIILTTATVIGLYLTLKGHFKKKKNEALD